MSSYASVSVSHDRDSSFYESPALSEAAPVATSSPQRVLAARKGEIFISPYDLFCFTDDLRSSQIRSRLFRA
jgi:hypothetical protein